MRTAPGIAPAQRGPILVILMALLGACDEGAPPPSLATPGQPRDSIADPRSDEGVYERNIVFMTAGADSVIVVPWLFRASTSEQGVERSAEGWLARAGLWEPFFTDHWDSPPTRTPFRIHARDPMDLVVGPGNVIERIVFQEGARQLQVVLGEGMSDWTGNRGQTFRVHRGAALFGNVRVEGMVMDMSRARLKDSPAPGEWMFLTGPERVAIVIESTGVSPSHTAWGRRGDREFRWPEVEVEWTSVRSFEEARRDVPVAWTIRSIDGDMEVSLASTGMDLQAGVGEGPLLPINGLYQVAGLWIMSGDTLDIRGLVRHVQR